MPEVLLSQYFADVIAMTHTYEVRKILMTNYSSFIQTCIAAFKNVKSTLEVNPKKYLDVEIIRINNTILF